MTLAALPDGAALMRLDPIDAVTCVPLTNVTGTEVPLKVAVAPETKLVPVIVSVNAPEPATVPQGDRAETVGVGLGCAAMVSVAPELVPPPGDGVVTVIVCVAVVDVSEASSAAVTRVLFT
jgi:hypothetical protein